MKLNRTFIIIFLILLAMAAGFFLQIVISLPEVENLSYYIPHEATVLIADNDQPFARFHEEENRRVVPLSKISPILQKAVVAVEDERFYQHHGIDLIGIVRASGKNLMYGRIVEGGSTLTQQLARNLYLTRNKTIGRKLAEIILALQIERRFTKEEILEFYLNQIYFGHNAYGAETAADLYFGKHARDLNLAESALLAGIIEGPEIYSPYKNFQIAQERQKIVLNKLLEQGVINQQDYEQALVLPLAFKPGNLKKYGRLGAYFTAQVSSDLIKRFGEEAVNRGGFKVYTTLNPEMQAVAEEVVTKFITEEGPKYNFSQCALVALDPRSGEVKVMVGGADFGKSQFNRATQMKRQPGSAFKPFVYAAAIEQGISPGTVLSDRPRQIDVIRNRWNPSGKWSPKNFDGRFRGNVTMRYALEHSLNLPSIELLEKVGIPSAISLARRLGIRSNLEYALALTLGVCEVTPLEITSAFGVFANQGIRVEPTLIKKIVNRDGMTVFENPKKGEQVLDANTAAIMVDMMKGVLIRGTGVRGRLSRPAAAKTGTTEEFKDAWIIGYTPQLVCGVWVGNDDNSHMKGVAEVAVCPRIFKEFMERALVNEAVLDFPPPTGLINVRICLSSGLLPNASCPKNRIVTGTFFEKDAPISECYVHPVESPASTEEDDENQGVEENLIDEEP